MTDIDYSDYLDNENNPEMAGFLLRLFASIIDTIFSLCYSFLLSAYLLQLQEGLVR